MDDNTVEALREVLQDMTMAIELISSGERSGAALIHFIEEMLKTIESWAAKYNVCLDDGSSAINPAQISHPNPNPHSTTNPQFQEAMDSLDVDQEVNGSLDMADPCTRQNSVEGDGVQQSMMSFNEEGITCNPEKGGTEMVGQQGAHSQVDQSSGISASLARRVSRKTRSQTASMHADTASTHDGEGKMLSPQSGESLKPQSAASVDEPDGSKGDVIESPNWLPEGWITEVKTRGSGGSNYKIYIDPTTKRHFRSKKDVLAFLGTSKRKRGRPRKNESLKSDSPSHASDTVQDGSVHETGVGGSNFELPSPSNASLSNKMSSEVLPTTSVTTVDTTKRKRGRPRKLDSIKSLPQTKEESGEHTTASSQDGAILESNIESQAPSSAPLPITNETQPLAAASSIPSTGPLSGIPLHHQSGQPSEWLVYESLASLPFPMFEHLRFVENNANKVVTNNSPPTLWPWMLGNSEGLKRPFTDIKLNETKPVEESKQIEETAPISSAGEPHASDAVPKRPKKAARKNAS